MCNCGQQQCIWE